MYTDVTDATFQSEVIDRSFQTTVVVDLWAPWCGPCRTLGPIIESAVDATRGAAVLVKVNVDENPGIAQAFNAQSIPLVVAIRDGRPVDGFMGAKPQHEVDAWVASLAPSEEELAISALLDEGSEQSLRSVLELVPGHEEAICLLAEILISRGDNNEALTLLGRIPENDVTRHLAAMARTHLQPDDDHDETLTALLDKVKDDEEARQQFVDILELMGPHDPRTAAYRKKLTSRLF